MPLKIGLLGVEDPAKISSYSGVPFHLAHFLRQRGHEVRICGPYPLRYQRLLLLLNRFLYRVTKIHIVWERFPLITRQYRKIIERYARENPDLDLFLATSVFYVDGPDIKMPLFVWGDTTAQGVMGLYPYYTGITKSMVEQSHAVEQRGLVACKGAIFSSDWAAQTAIESYDVDPAKVHVITYGANILESPDAGALERFLVERVAMPWTVILVGADWKRKGVDKAIAAVGVLRERGLSVRLRIVGCRPPATVQVPDYVDVLGRIPKSTPEGQKRYYEMLQTSHAFILPSIAECAAVSLVEANAYGLPVVASDAGGNPSLVKEGQNGYLCSAADAAEVWADALEKILGERTEYEKFSRKAFALYHSEFSWEIAVSRFERLIGKILSDQPVEIS
jgi:glycosyltransferase involved in cell wall biosynthesis